MLHISNKLVRDNIPDIIQSKGGWAQTKILEEEDYRLALIEKMNEETQEFKKDNTAEELADIYEVLLALISTSGKTLEEIKEIADAKRSKNGAFEKRIFMEMYSDGSVLR